MRKLRYAYELIRKLAQVSNLVTFDFEVSYIQHFRFIHAKIRRPVINVCFTALCVFQIFIQLYYSVIMASKYHDHYIH